MKPKLKMEPLSLKADLAISKFGSEYTPLILMIPTIASIIFFTIAVRTSREKYLTKV